jgi:hypothetical protein
MSAEEQFFGKKAADFVAEFEVCSRPRTIKGRAALGALAVAGGIYVGGTTTSIVGGAVMTYAGARGLLGAVRMARRALKARKQD